MGDWNLREVAVIDLESTCWDTPEEKAANTSEIIEVGICILDVITGEIRKPQGLIVKPRHSKISPFCEQLTSITQDMVDHGMRFEKAMKILRREYGVGRRMMAAFGNYDQRMLKDECQRCDIPSPFSPTYLNVSALATLKRKLGKRSGLRTTCNAFGLEFEGRPHRGVDDAVMAAKILWEIIK